jgi:hypothetical protein
MANNSYQINFSDSVKNNNGGVGIYVPEQQSVSVSNLTLIGRNWPGYAQAIDQNFLYLLENSASSSAPDNAVEGQLWYDSAHQVLKVRNGLSAWIPVNGVWQVSATSTGDFPSDQGSPKPGDIWVNTLTDELKIYNGNTWILVGPTTTTGTKNGAYPTILVDNAEQPHSVIIMYLNDVAVEIIAKEAFKPNPIISGFNYLNIGVNLNSSISSNTPIFSGLTTVASSLQQVSTAGLIQTVSGNSFIRNDINQSINGQFVINDDNGLKIGKSTSTVIIEKSFDKAVFTNAWFGGQFVFKTFDTNKKIHQILTINGYTSTGTVGINQINPQKELDVNGSGNITNQLFVNYSTSSDYPAYQSTKFIVGGGSSLAGNVNIGSSLYVSSTSTFVGTSTFRSTILSANSNSNIGSTLIPFNQIYAKEIGKDDAATYTTIYHGVLKGSANSLTTATNFSLNGVIASQSPVPFDGTQRNLSMTTTVTVKLIKDLASYPIGSIFAGSTQLIPLSSDLIPIYTAGAVDRTVGIYNVTKGSFLGDVLPKLTPPGTLAPYAGTVLPKDLNGNLTWVWCDGAAYDTGNQLYSALYKVIGTTYGSYTSGASYFLVPNLNGPTTTTNSGGDGPFNLYTTSTVGVANQSVPSRGIRYIIKL